MKNPKINLGFNKLGKALIVLEKIAKKLPEEHRSYVDATIQRADQIYKNIQSYILVLRQDCDTLLRDFYEA